MVKFSKKGNATLRRKTALAFLEKKLQKWNTHNEDFKNHKNSRSHEAEKVRLETEIATLKSRI